MLLDFRVSLNPTHTKSLSTVKPCDFLCKSPRHNHTVTLNPCSSPVHDPCRNSGTFLHISLVNHLSLRPISLSSTYSFFAHFALTRVPATPSQWSTSSCRSRLRDASQDLCADYPVRWSTKALTMHHGQVTTARVWALFGFPIACGRPALFGPKRNTGASLTLDKGETIYTGKSPGTSEHKSGVNLLPPRSKKTWDLDPKWQNRPYKKPPNLRVTCLKLS